MFPRRRTLGKYSMWSPDKERWFELDIDIIYEDNDANADIDVDNDVYGHPPCPPGHEQQDKCEGQCRGDDGVGPCL
jgi:hypothetical protein